MRRRQKSFGSAAATLACLLVTSLLATSCTSSSDPSAGAPRATPSIAIHSDDETIPGAEAASPSAGDSCRIVGRAALARRFGGTVVSETASTTPIGDPLCTFTMSRSNLGLPGVITVTSYASGGLVAYRRLRADSLHPADLVGVGDQAFYAARTGTLALLKGRALVVVRAVFRVPAGRSAPISELKSDLIHFAPAVSG
jgi:hypothetical protein